MKITSIETHQSVQERLKGGCSACKKKPLRPEDAYPATVHLALPDHDEQGRPLDDDELSWTQTGRNIVFVCTQCAAQISAKGPLHHPSRHQEADG